MNTQITLKIIQSGESTLSVQDAFESGFYEFERIVKEFSRFDSKSELSRLNNRDQSLCLDKKNSIYKPSEELFDLIDRMLEISEKTNGAFDPTVIDILEFYGYNPSYDFSKMEDPNFKSALNELIANRKSWKDILLDKKNKTVTLPRNVRIDLGGAGKGYAIDCAYDSIKKSRIENFLIDAGGDIRCSGKNLEGNKWRVELRGKEKALGDIELESGQSVASSGSWARRFKSFHHLLNTQTGNPSENFQTVFVVADSAIEADMWATAIFVGGEELVKQKPELKYFVESALFNS